MKKAVFFDIDGTLWNYQMQRPESAVWAIRKLRENGHYAFICSGRSRSNIQSPKLLGIGFDGVVASCGAHIDFHKETAYQVLLTEKQVTYALNVLKKYQYKNRILVLDSNGLLIEELNKINCQLNYLGSYKLDRYSFETYIIEQ